MTADEPLQEYSEGWDDSYWDQYSRDWDDREIPCKTAWDDHDWLSVYLPPSYAVREKRKKRRTYEYR
jgi:hypothetical protein